jgi:hypothetical protein
VVSQLGLAKYKQVLLKMIVNGLFSHKGSTYTSGPMFIGIKLLKEIDVKCD